jgi:two-component system sensor histidine kinase RegB
MVLAFVAVTILAFYHWPLPWFGDAPLRLPVTYVVGLWSALVLGIGFTSVYAWRIATEAKRMSDALAATQAVLAREQRMSAVGGLAAAAAHELGTPLATIALVAKELKRTLPNKGPLAEDVTLLGSQVERCREILRRLSVRPEESEGALGEAAIGAVLDEVITPHRGFGITIEFSLAHDNAQQPLVRRSPELLHGLGNLIENAVDFARSRVQVEARWDDARISVTVTDDGPGFSPEVLDRLGEPYVSTRGAATDLSAGEPEVPQGMGLGFFIAKTLLERIGAKISVTNLGGTGGASVTVSWPRGPAREAAVVAAPSMPQAAL